MAQFFYSWPAETTVDQNPDRLLSNEITIIPNAELDLGP